MRNRDCFVASLDFMRCLLSFACSGTWREPGRPTCKPSACGESTGVWWCV